MKISKGRLKEIIADVLREESDYQAFFKKALEKTGKSIPQMSDEEKKDFFNKIEKAWKGKGEKSESIEESINEGASSEEKRIVMLAVRKIAKYRSVNIKTAVVDVMRAAQELERDIEKGKVKK